MTIDRIGAKRLTAVGLVLTGLSAGIGLVGMHVEHFWATLILLGMGWNFGFLGASSLVLESQQPEEKIPVQSLNDFIVFGFMALGSFSSGWLLSTYGWNTVLWISFVPLVIAILALLMTKLGNREKLNGLGVDF